jgi:hypothetical protein
VCHSHSTASAPGTLSHLSLTLCSELQSLFTQSLTDWVSQCRLSPWTWTHYYTSPVTALQPFYHWSAWCQWWSGWSDVHHVSKKLPHFYQEQLIHHHKTVQMIKAGYTRSLLELKFVWFSWKKSSSLITDYWTIIRCFAKEFWKLHVVSEKSDFESLINSKFGVWSGPGV